MAIAKNVRLRSKRNFRDSKRVHVELDCIPKASRFYGAPLTQGLNVIEIPEDLVAEAEAQVYDVEWYKRAKEQHESNLLKWLADPKNEKKTEKDYTGSIGAVYKQMTAGRELGRFRSVKVVKAGIPAPLTEQEEAIVRLQSRIDEGKAAPKKAAASK